MRQIYLNFWKKDYESDFIIGDSNFNAQQILLNMNSNVCLVGPRFSGKKHLIYQISKIKNINVYFLDLMQDQEIIAKFDQESGVWIKGNASNFSPDVLSRIHSMFLAEIFELTQDMLFPLLMTRLERVGLKLRSDLFNYILYHIPLKYSFIESLIQSLLTLKIITLESIKDILIKLNH